MKITFLGDIMCELPVLKAAKRETGYDFSGVFAPSKKLLAKSDFVIGNLETPLAGEAAGYSESHLAFNAPDEYADALKAAGLRYSSKKKMWYWRPEEAACHKSRRNTTMGDIRRKYGSDRIKASTGGFNLALDC